MDVRAGAAGQRLHRDDKNFHMDHTDRTETGYQRENDLLMGVLIPGVESTKENGATLVCSVSARNARLFTDSSSGHSW